MLCHAKVRFITGSRLCSLRRRGHVHRAGQGNDPDPKPQDPDKQGRQAADASLSVQCTYCRMQCIIPKVAAQLVRGEVAGREASAGVPTTLLEQGTFVCLHRMAMATMCFLFFASCHRVYLWESRFGQASPSSENGQAHTSAVYHTGRDTGPGTLCHGSYEADTGPHLEHVVYLYN